MKARELEKREMVEIYLKEFGVYFLPDSCQCKMEVETYGEARGKLLIDLLSCKGKMNVRQVDSKGKLVAEAIYEESLDTLKRYSVGRSAVIDTSTLSVMKYFQPLPDGIWKFFNNGKVDTVVYKGGLEMKPKFSMRTTSDF